MSSFQLRSEVSGSGIDAKAARVAGNINAGCFRYSFQSQSLRNLLYTFRGRLQGSGRESERNQSVQSQL